MNIEWVNVADTAVKIGLGGIISGIFTYLGLKYSHKSQQSKYLFEHKIKLVEQITADIDEYFTALSSYVGQISGIAKTRNIQSFEEKPLEQSQWDAIRKYDSLLVLSVPKRTYAVAKLRLLKANNVVQKLQQCFELESELRDKIIFIKEMYKYDELQNYIEKLRKAKLDVHDSLSDFYDSLLK